MTDNDGVCNSWVHLQVNKTKKTFEHAPKSVHLWSLHGAVVGELPAATAHPFAKQRSKTRWQQPRIQVE